MTENKGKKFTDSAEAEELSLEDCGRVAGGLSSSGGGRGYSSSNLFPDDINNGSAKKGIYL